MTNALLSPAVGAAMYTASAAAIAYSVKKIKEDEMRKEKIPVMGVMGALVFAAQMVNFTIPGTGSSGHICGGILLAAMIGGFPALLTISAVLIIQCLFFADGGLLALGCNIFNMGVIPCLIVYPLVFKPLINKKMTAGIISLASMAAVVIGLQLGAFGVVLETRLSGITELPFSTFVVLIQPIHLAIGVVEGLITAAVLCLVYKKQPEIMKSAFNRTAIKSPIKNTLVILALVTLFTGGVLSMFASSNPDGLEWAIEKTAGITMLETSATVMNSAAAGILGSLLAFLLAGITAFTVYTIKKKRKGFVTV
jgi:cobalt/nickel transport system permease protein